MKYYIHYDILIILTPTFCMEIPLFTTVTLRNDRFSVYVK
jgi:hypothetical protein